MKTMKKIYEASNSIEAKLLLDLIEQAGLNARVDGEYLQGAMGGLPASGLLTIRVAEEDFADAEEVLRQWDSGEFITSEDEE